MGSITGMSSLTWVSIRRGAMSISIVDLSRCPGKHLFLVHHGKALTAVRLKHTDIIEAICNSCKSYVDKSLDTSSRCNEYLHIDYYVLQSVRWCYSLHLILWKHYYIQSSGLPHSYRTHRLKTQRLLEVSKIATSLPEWVSSSRYTTSWLGCNIVWTMATEVFHQHEGYF